MTYNPEVKKDLVKVLVIFLFFSSILVGLKMYDAKTGEIWKIGEKILRTYIK